MLGKFVMIIVVLGVMFLAVTGMILADKGFSKLQAHYEQTIQGG